MQKIISSIKTAAAITVVAAISACASTSSDTNMKSDKQELSRYIWTLNSSTNADGASTSKWTEPLDNPLAILFHEENLNISGLCNSLIATYETQGTNITVGPVAGTLKMCANQEVMGLEQEVSRHISKAQKWQISDSPNNSSKSLTLTFNDNSTWELSGELTNEARYNSEGEIMFLEIAPQKVECNDPNRPEHHCLNARTVSYAENGVQTEVGEWQPFYGNIEGYEHTDGVRNILRVKRFEKPNPPQDTSKYDYYLDMIIASGQ